MRSLSCIAAVVLLCTVAAGQETRGRISGTVTDPQGAAAAGAAVTVTNTDTGTAVRLVTNVSGYYEASYLLPGRYSISVELSGFKRAVRSGLTLALGEEITINFQLEVGALAEAVTITAEAPLLDTSTVTTGRNLSHREVLDLPVLGNNVTMLVRYAPGVQVPGTTQFLVQGQIGGGSQYYMPGAVGGNEWSIDGASSNGTDRRTSFMPSPDIIGEFKVEAANFDASFGHATGLNISMSTKSGANNYHGTATYQYFNQRWNAASFFVKQKYYREIAEARAAGNFALADQLARRPMVPAGHTNNFHGSLSGPIRIPKLFDGRNKLFFFLGYSKLNNLQAARPAEINYTVPTVAMRNGDFSPLLQVDAVRYVVHDPLTTRPDPARPGHVVRTPFPGNVVPRARFVNPIYDFYAKRMPLPNNDPADPRREPVNNYLATGMPNNVFYEAWNNRFDYQPSEKHRFFMRWLMSDFLEDAQDYTYETEPGLMAWNEKRPSFNALLDWTFVESSSTVWNVALATSRFYLQNQRLGTRKYKPSDVGLPAYLDQKCAGSCALPRVIWPGMTAWSGDMVLSTSVDPGAQGRQHMLKVNFSQVRGTHSLRAGADVRQHHRTQRQFGGFTSGNFSFANTYVRKDEDGFTPAGSLGLVWATFLIGIPNAMSIDTNDTYALMNPYFAWYGQDTWRVTRRLTLTLGLRVEYEKGPTERYDRALSYFDPNLTLPIAAAAQAAYARNPLPELPASAFIVKGGSVYVGRNGVDRKLWRNELMWLPRLSAAWELNSRTVLRGGFGLYFDTLNVMNQAPDQYGFSRATSTTLTNDFGINWLVGDPKNGISPLKDPFPVRSDGTRFDVPLRAALGPMARVGQGFTYTDYNRSHPRISRWRLGLQRQLSPNMAIEAAYWGQRAARINITRRLDALPSQYWATGNVRNDAVATDMNRQVPNPFHISNFESLRVSDPVLYQHLSTLPQFTSPTIAKNRLLRPFPHMNGLNNSADAKGKGRTDALELSFQRRLSHGLNVNAAYTRLRQDDLTIFENEFEPEPRIWWPSNNARPHRLTVTGIYEFPFGRGRAALQQGIAGHILGGWQVAFTYEFQPGPLLSWGNLFYYGDIKTFESDATSTTKTLDQWFNTNLAFERVAARQPAAFHVRIFPRFFNKLRADGLSQWNANLTRDFRILEQLRLQVRADAINLQNRSQMAAPDLSPTSTNFGRITSQTASLNRFYQFQARILF